MHVILGATGHTGSVVAHKLLEQGKKVRVVGRDSKKLAPFASRGAEAFVGDVLDTGAMNKAFAGAEGVYALIPPLMTSPDFRAYQEQVTVADGTKEMAKRIERVLTNDPGMGVVRHADAGYPEAIAFAKKTGVKVPML